MLNQCTEQTRVLESAPAPFPPTTQARPSTTTRTSYQTCTRIIPARTVGRRTANRLNYSRQRKTTTTSPLCREKAIARFSSQSRDRTNTRSKSPRERLRIKQSLETRCHSRRLRYLYRQRLLHSLSDRTKRMKRRQTQTNLSLSSRTRPPFSGGTQSPTNRQNLERTRRKNMNSHRRRRFDLVLPRYTKLSSFLLNTWTSLSLSFARIVSALSRSSSSANQT